MKELVSAILRLIRKIELGRQHRPLRRLDLDVIVAGAPGIEARHDGAEGVAPLCVGEDVAAQTEALVVVFAAGVGMPQVNQRICDRAARAGEYHARKLDRAARDASLAQIAAPRRLRLEERPFSLRESWLVAVVARRRRGDVRLSPGVADGERKTR